MILYHYNIRIIFDLCIPYIVDKVVVKLFVLQTEQDQHKLERCQFAFENGLLLQYILKILCVVIAYILSLNEPRMKRLKAAIANIFKILVNFIAD